MTSTVVVRDSKHGNSRSAYVRCESLEPFEVPADMDASTSTTANAAGDRDVTPRRKTTATRTSRRLTAKEVNETLNLNLGLPIDPDDGRIRNLCRFLSNLFSVFEEHVFAVIGRLPLSFKQRINKLGWLIYFPLHKLLLGRKTAIHPDASYEYHALTTLMHWGRLFPVSIERMRFSLSQLSVWHPPEAYPHCLRTYGSIVGSSRRRQVLGSTKAVVKKISYDMADTCRLATGITDTEAQGSTVVTGFYVQHDPTKPSEKVLFWLYGGAYLSGDSLGNLPLAEKTAQRCHDMDVFLPNYRLLPENSFFDAFYDVVQAYEYLVTVRGVNPENITCLGISSGGGLVVRLLQTLAERRKELGITEKATSDIPKSKERLELENLLTNPNGGVLMSPFVDYTVESCTEPGSFTEYIKHDLIVNQSVIEEGLQYFDNLGDAKVRRQESPVHRSFDGLPPLCVVFSEHEAVYDQNKLLANNARAAGVKVTCGCWKYMCHVWPMLSMFIPEAREALDFMVDWVNDNN